MKLDYEIVNQAILADDEEIKRNKYSELIWWYKRHPSEFIYYITGKRLPLWHRIYVDNIYPIIKKMF